MRRLFCCAVLCLCLSEAPCAAAGYDNFANGTSALNRGEIDLAITEFTVALTAGDLSPNLVPTAHFERARAYIRKSQCAAARDDLTDALKLKGDYEDAFVLRATVNRCLGDYKASVDDLSQAIALNALPARYLARGRAHWDAGEFAACAADLRTGYAKMSGERHFGAVLWAEMCELRAGTLSPDDIAKDKSELDLDGWPRALFDLFQGRAAPADVDTAAAYGDAANLSRQACEAAFYEAEWQLAGRNEDEAKRLLTKARETCPHNFAEFEAAKIDSRQR